jgi:signal transduction histidine kinase
MVINFFRNFFRLVVNEKRFYFSHTTESIAHELRSPIFNIKAFLETMYEYNSTLTEFESLEFLEILNKEILRLTHLIDNLLDLYSLNSKDILYRNIKLHYIFDLIPIKEYCYYHFVIPQIYFN